jgi:hypothetical protein
MRPEMLLGLLVGGLATVFGREGYAEREREREREGG